jgi:hypothetical protein
MKSPQTVCASLLLLSGLALVQADKPAERTLSQVLDRSITSLER